MTPEEIIGEFLKLEPAEPNEAETRLKLIDEILFGPLGWLKSEVAVEERVSEDKKNTYADYILRTANISIIVEAKKVGAGRLVAPRDRTRSLTGPWLRTDIGSFIKQARDYARKKSIGFSVVTDGNFWIVFPASRTDGVTFEQSTCYIFPDITSALRDEYSEFLSILSRDSLINNSLYSYLIGTQKDQFGEHRLNRHFDYAVAPKRTSPIYPFISDAIHDAFTEDLIKRDPETLKRCYVTTPQRQRFDNRIKMHLARREGPTGRRSLRAMNDGDQRTIIASIENAARKTKPSAIMVFGQVGAGKSTFLHHLRHVSAAEVFDAALEENRQHWIYVDFREFSPESDVETFYVEQVVNHISNDSFLSDYDKCLKYAYKDDIEALFRGPLSLVAKDSAIRDQKTAEFLFDEFKNKRRYVEKVIGYACRNRAVFVVFDNIDQIESDETQLKIISALLAFSQRTHSSIIIALRGGTYLRQRNSAALDAFDYDPISIEPPEVKPVLASRFLVARELLRGRKAEFVSEAGAKVYTDDVGVFVDIVRDSVLESKVSEVIDVLSAGDIRLALRMTREFMEYGYSEPAKALQSHQSNQRYKLPQHEAVRAIMLGNGSIYNGEQSVIGNMFDTRRERNAEQYLKIFISNFLVTTAQRAESFVPVSDIIQNCNKIGFGEDATFQVVRQLSEERYIISKSDRELSGESSVAASRLCGRFLKEFIADLVMIENMAMDTFIDDEKAWKELYDVTERVHANRDPVERLKLRAERARLFYHHAEQHVENLVAAARRVPLASDWLSNPLMEQRQKFLDNIDAAEQSALRNYGKNRRAAQKLKK